MPISKFIAFLILMGLSSVISSKRSMAWLCLEFCGENSTVTQAYLDDLSHHMDQMTAVSFERYQLAANATLVRAEVTDVVGQLQAMGVKETWPMLSSFPHPPEFIDWMRDAFANVEKFTQQVCILLYICHYFMYPVC